MNRNVRKHAQAHTHTSARINRHTHGDTCTDTLVHRKAHLLGRLHAPMPRYIHSQKCTGQKHTHTQIDGNIHIDNCARKHTHRKIHLHAQRCTHMHRQIQKITYLIILFKTANGQILEKCIHSKWFLFHFHAFILSWQPFVNSLSK